MKVGFRPAMDVVSESLFILLIPCTLPICKFQETHIALSTFQAILPHVVFFRSKMDDIYPKQKQCKYFSPFNQSMIHFHVSTYMNSRLSKWQNKLSFNYPYPQGQQIY